MGFGTASTNKKQAKAVLFACRSLRVSAATTARTPQQRAALRRSDGREVQVCVHFRAPAPFDAWKQPTVQTLLCGSSVTTNAGPKEQQQPQKMTGYQ